MRLFQRGAGLLAFAVALLVAEPRAQADDLLVMAYACTVVGGQPLLTPGPEQSHRIIGPRDQRKFSACSPVNAEMCRHWTVHRFDLDCGGTRVSWVSVVAATNEGNRRAWLLDGRLVLRMGPTWSLAPDDPCAQEPDPDDRSGRRMRRYCADRLALAPPPMVEMPFGYAPMLGIDGIIVKAAPGISAAPPPAKTAAADLPPQPAGELPIFRPEPPLAPAAREAPVKPALPASPSVTLQQPQPPPKVVAATPAAPTVMPPIAEAPKVTAVEAKSAAPPVGPPKATVPKAETSAAAPVLVEAPRPTRAERKPAPPAAEAEVAPAKEDLRSAPPSKQAAEPEGNGFSINFLSVFRATTTGAIVAFTGLALGLLTAFALARRREHARDARKRPRDLATVSLDGKRARPTARRREDQRAPPPNAVAPPTSRVPERASAAMAEWADRMPRTKVEAFQVLGIGVAPSATEAAIKKIVDGLRQSWHPDHAKDEADRVLRELRSKQINAAWELLRIQRAEV